WAVHGETSTGGLNSLRALRELADHAGAALAVDVVSSLGAGPIDLNGVTFASGVSGKSIGAPAGLSFVFHTEPPASPGRLPRALDLGWYRARDGVPFTLPSALVAATVAALEQESPEARFAVIADRTDRLIAGLRSIGFEPFAPEPRAPGFVTVRVGSPWTAERLSDRLAKRGIRANRSVYLRERSLVQFAVIGRPSPAGLNRLTAALADFADRGIDDAPVGCGPACSPERRV
ncbi:MAG: hypothetical protein AAF907_08775, partial [Planctomycetota bacterium]